MHTKIIRQGNTTHHLQYNGGRLVGYTKVISKQPNKTCVSSCVENYYGTREYCREYCAGYYIAPRS